MTGQGAIQIKFGWRHGVVWSEHCLQPTTRWSTGRTRPPTRDIWPRWKCLTGIGRIGFCLSAVPLLIHRDGSLLGW